MGCAVSVDEVQVFTILLLLKYQNWAFHCVQKRLVIYEIAPFIGPSCKYACNAVVNQHENGNDEAYE